MTYYDLRNDTLGYKGRVMANFESLRDGSALVMSTAARLAFAATMGTLVYDSSMTSYFQWNSASWIQVG